MRIAWRVAGAMVAAGALRLVLAAAVPTADLAGEVHGVAAYVTVIGGMYGIIIAFVMFVVWEQFNHVQMGLEKEASALEDLCRVSRFLSEPDSANRIRFALRPYVRDTVSDEPVRLAAAQRSVVAHEAFTAVAESVRYAAVVTPKDAIACEELIRALSRVIAARDERLAVSAARIPRTLWVLVVFVSVALFGGFLVLGVQSLVLSILVVAAAAGTMTFLLSVLKDMDNPFVGVWRVSYAPLTNAVARAG